MVVYRGYKSKQSDHTQALSQPTVDDLRWAQGASVIFPSGHTIISVGDTSTVIRFNGSFHLLCSSPGEASLLIDGSIHNSWEETDAITTAGTLGQKERKTLQI